jgi:hypothetical protein
MAKRTAEVSPNSQRLNNKKPTKKELASLIAKGLIPSTSRGLAGSTHPTTPSVTPDNPSGATPTDTTPGQSSNSTKSTPSTVIHTSTPRYEKTNDTLHNSMNSIPDQSPEISRHSAFVSKPLDHIILEVYKKDDEPFDGILPRDTLKLLWTELGRKVDEIRVLKRERIQGKKLKVTYNLRKEVPLLEISQSYEILIEAKLGSKTHVFGAKFPQFREIVCDLGQLITVTACNIPSDVDSEDLKEWFEVFGSVKGTFRYKF